MSYVIDDAQGNYNVPTLAETYNDELPSSIKNSCYAFVQYRLGKLPSMEYLQHIANKTSEGNIAVFMYPPTPDFPDGLPHVGEVISRLSDGFWVIESNYIKGAISIRFVRYDNSRFVGFSGV